MIFFESTACSRIELVAASIYLGIALSRTVWRIDLEQSVSGADPTHRRTAKRSNRVQRNVRPAANFGNTWRAALVLRTIATLLSLGRLALLPVTRHFVVEVYEDAHRVADRRLRRSEMSRTSAQNGPGWLSLYTCDVGRRMSDDGGWTSAYFFILRALPSNVVTIACINPSLVM